MVDIQIPDTARILGLSPHPEGGWYRRTYTSTTLFKVPGRGHQRPIGSAILFYLAPGEQSRWHAVIPDELWLWHSSSPLELFINQSGPIENTSPVVLGPDIQSDQHPQLLVPGGSWQAARPQDGGETLVSCALFPGFDFDDLTLAPAEDRDIRIPKS
ncbi:cupin domain-containing protein [Mycobacterium shimoidei]|uniref:cupin domain-containing protein n=1 Tax=Mycobacterium shimoidei TaxID=29313 RepID=UPI0008483B3C|nr:cupin domain-containing protein [Mycobacterium shimoidei]MCV7258013.1 cupin domain-containing protein [Mycobacterium shimoidei]ODR05656.1 cupin [Mycobacterium shimoidei]ORW76010.1 cupin [Mycobacterium shimoidei]